MRCLFAPEKMGFGPLGKELSWRRLSEREQTRMTIERHHRALFYLLSHIPETV